MMKSLECCWAVVVGLMWWWWWWLVEGDPLILSHARNNIFEQRSLSPSRSLANTLVRSTQYQFSLSLSISVTVSFSHTFSLFQREAHSHKLVLPYTLPPSLSFSRSLSLFGALERQNIRRSVERSAERELLQQRRRRRRGRKHFLLQLLIPNWVSFQRNWVQMKSFLCACVRLKQLLCIIEAPSSWI